MFHKKSFFVKQRPHSKTGSDKANLEVYLAFRKASDCGLELVVHVDVDDDVGHTESLFGHLNPLFNNPMSQSLL
jgi:hypothetical protein